jgi:paraquat-inducible protein B
MSKKANPAVVGSFVIGAITLSIIGIMLLGGGSFFEERFECIMYFDESISGLDVGAPVDFRGVRVGTVTDVRLVVDGGDNIQVLRPVKIQIERNRIHRSDNRNPRSDLGEALEALVNEHGLRARLASQSMLTGKLKVELGYHPNQPVVRRNRDPGTWEMPTIHSPLKQVSEEFAQLPLAEIVNETHRAINGLANAINSEDAGETIKNINVSLKRLESVLSRIDEKIDPLSEQTAGVMTSARSTLDELQGTLQKIEASLDPMIRSMNKTSEQVSLMLDPESRVRGEMAMLVEDMRQTSKSLRQLTDFLQQHPESLLRGKN